MPSVYKEKEIELRTMIGNALSRGKVDFMLYVESKEAETSNKINKTVLASYKNQISDAAKELGVAEPADWMTLLLRMPDVMQNELAEIDEEEWEAAKKVVEEALTKIVEYRKSEGVSLKNVFVKNLEAISSLLESVEPFEKSRVENIKIRIRESLASLNVDVDKNRFEQEMIFYIEKLDVSEEKNRLRHHINAYYETMAMKEESIGKKLGFIAQEMGREINTLGSKSNQAEMQMIVVKMKDELEQIKEQVLNVL
jgi:uncharacterized protein (TIGR00255 family)